MKKIINATLKERFADIHSIEQQKIVSNDTSGVCVRYDGLQPVVPHTHTTGSKITLSNTDQAHDKHQ